MLRVILGCDPDEAERVRPLALRAYAEARARRWPFLSDVLQPLLRDAAEEDRAVVTAAVHALVKYDRLLAFACGGEDADPAARFEVLLALARGASSGSGDVVREQANDRAVVAAGADTATATAAAADVAKRLARIERRSERLAVAYSFPDWIVDVVAGELGEAALEPALARMNALAPRVARVNTLKTTRDACLAALEAEGLAARPTAHAAAGLVLEGRRSPFRTRAFARGELEMQDEASQLVAELVAPPPRSFTIDACAGAGGKTLALAALLGGKGKLVALDASEDKLEELRRRARRAGASNVQALAVDLLGPRHADDALASFEGAASRVLVDAPCTGLGAIRRNPEARWRLRRDDLSRLVASQAGLLDAAARLVTPNGRVVYATCSFLPSEGELAVDFFLSQHPDFGVVTARDVLGRAKTERVATSDGKYLRTWRFDGGPQSDGAEAGMDGFFAAVLRRRA
jgi:16S rRNA (cytosine967-C5)-methyltransferase